MYFMFLFVLVYMKLIEFFECNRVGVHISTVVRE